MGLLFKPRYFQLSVRTPYVVIYSDIDPYEFIAGFQKKLEFDPNKLKVFLFAYLYSQPQLVLASVCILCKRN